MLKAIITAVLVIMAVLFLIAGFLFSFSKTVEYVKVMAIKSFGVAGAVWDWGKTLVTEAKPILKDIKDNINKTQENGPED